MGVLLSICSSKEAIYLLNLLDCTYLEMATLFYMAVVAIVSRRNESQRTRAYMYMYLFTTCRWKASYRSRLKRVFMSLFSGLVIPFLLDYTVEGVIAKTLASHISADGHSIVLSSKDAIFVDTRYVNLHGSVILRSDEAIWRRAAYSLKIVMRETWMNAIQVSQYSNQGYVYEEMLKWGLPKVCIFCDDDRRA